MAWYHEKKVPHPADADAEAKMIIAIRSADHFMASLFLGVGKYEKRTGSTVRAAILIGANMVQLRKAQNKPLIYAVAKDGTATYLTPQLIKKLTGWEF